MLFSNSSPSYLSLKPVSASSGGAAGPAPLTTTAACGAAGIAGDRRAGTRARRRGAAWAVMRRRTADERE